MVMGFLEALKTGFRVLEDRSCLRVVPSGDLLIIGDLHGDQRALNLILGREDVYRGLSEGLCLVFLGDYVDRGPQSVETLSTICHLLSKYPDQVIPLRGNHEGPSNQPALPSSFLTQLSEVDSAAALHVMRFFGVLPLCAVIPGYAFLVHGHIPHDSMNLDLISQGCKSSVSTELLWNDPAITPLNHPSFRGHGYYVGTDAVSCFLKHNDLRWIIRGHENPPQGYEIIYKTLTVHTTGTPITYLRIPRCHPCPPEEYIRQLP